ARLWRSVTASSPTSSSFFFSSRRRHTRSYGDWSSDVCSSDLVIVKRLFGPNHARERLALDAARVLVRQVGLQRRIKFVSLTQPQIGRASCREREKISGDGAGA